MSQQKRKIEDVLLLGMYLFNKESTESKHAKYSSQFHSSSSKIQKERWNTVHYERKNRIYAGIQGRNRSFS